MYRRGFSAEFDSISIAVLNSLLQYLIAKGVLTKNEVREIYERAASDLRPFNTDIAQRSVSIIAKHLLPLFPKDDGTKSAS